VDLSASGRIITIPNIISAVRIAMIPLFAWALSTGSNYLLAFVLIFIIGSSDWVDGYVARRTGQVSRLGKLLDPVADRAAIVVLLIVLTMNGTVPLPLAATILLRDLIVTLVFPVLEAKGFPRLPVNRMGKLATALIFTGLGSAVVSLAFARIEDLAIGVSTAFLTAGSVLYWVAGLLYVREIRRLMRQGVGSR
jgi:cardiolipin synthase